MKQKEAQVATKTQNSGSKRLSTRKPTQQVVEDSDSDEYYDEEDD